MWMRSCAVCKALLRKLRPSDSVHCRFGWEWLGFSKQAKNGESHRVLQTEQL
jgi:hypothetical protein